MFYWIWLKDKKGEPYVFRDSFLPGIFKESQIEHTYDQFVEKLGLCKACSGNFSHVIEEGTGRKFCPILFSDLVRPGWTIRNVV